MMNVKNRLAIGVAVATCLAGSGCTDKPPIAEGDAGVTAWHRFLQAASSSAMAQSGVPPHLKKGFVGNIDRLTETNEDYRRVLYTGQHLQLVLMSLKPGEEIGEEVHGDGDQFFRVEAGEGEIVINRAKHRVSAGSAMVVPGGARHNVRNTGKGPLKIYTLYAPPEHRRDVVERTKEDAERQHQPFDGKTSE
jgi:mannose-6-phosphate isomerase-like protein (cupin superfamily)